MAERKRIRVTNVVDGLVQGVHVGATGETDPDADLEVTNVVGGDASGVIQAGVVTGPIVFGHRD